MEQRSRIDKQQEGTVKPTGKARKSGSRPWEIGQYIYQEPKDDQRPSHGDPRLELERPQLDEHDNDFSDDDGNHGSGPSVFSATPNLDARDPSASDQGTLAGGAFMSRQMIRLANKIDNWADRVDNWNQQRERRDILRAVTEAQYQVRGLIGDIARRERRARSEGQRR